MSSFAPKFWKPGTDAPGQAIKEERTTTTEEGGTTVVYNQNISLSIEQQRQKLPVFKLRNHILYLVENYQTVVIVGETGCGKSTQIPQYLLEAGWGAEGHVIGVTQPRRVAAVTVATRVAEERGALLGDEVGYTIRFDDTSDPTRTRVKFLTDGMMIREIMEDPLLKKYSVVMLDEAHERTLNTDLIMGLLRKIQKKREDLRLIVTSATLNAEEMKDFFNTSSSENSNKDTAAILSVEGRNFPVDIHYTIDPVPDYLKATVDTITRIHHQEKEGDILAFLTGQDEVETVTRQLIDVAKECIRTQAAMKMKVLPMYGSLPASEQMKVFERCGRTTRKIVVATNIAETSITIPGIVYIVDCGFVKLKAYNPKSSVESLVTIPVSKSSAEQRAGRAGRVRAGKAYRLYTEEGYDGLESSTVPEMQRSDLAPVILQMKALGVSNIVRFNFLSPPPAQNMIRGLELLYALQALDDNGNLTSPLGLQMAEFPLTPMFSKMLLASGEFQCSEEAVIIAAMTQIQNVFITPMGEKSAANRAKRNFAVEEGDHVSLLNVFRAFIKYKKNSKWCKQNFLNYKGLCRAVEIQHQLQRLLKKFKVPLVSCQEDVCLIRRCITSGFFANAAYLHYTGVYRTVRDDHELHIHPTSVLTFTDPPKWVVFNDIVQTNKDYMRDISVIEPDWLCELAPHFYQFGTEREIAYKRAKRDEQGR